MTRRPNLYSLLLLCLFIGICGCDSKNTTQQPQGIPVKAFTIKRADQALVGQYTGQTAGYREIQVRAQVGGILLKRDYQEGTMVEKGQSLFQIDPAPYQAELMRAQGTLKQAQAALNNAQLEHKRVIPLYAQNAVSQKVRDAAVAALDSAKADVQAAEAAVRLAKINLEYTRVYAPITGMSSRETVSEGSLIIAGDPTSSLLTTITQYDPIYVNFSPPNSTVFAMRLLTHQGKLYLPEDGLDLSITLPDGTPYEYTGKVDFIDRQVDPATGTVRMRAVFKNPHNLIFPGQFVKVTLTGHYLKQVITIPQRAILQTQQGSTVWIIGQDNKVKAQLVEPGMAIDNNVVINNGLEEGQIIVLEGINKLSNGALVTILPDDKG